jgi:L-fuculose-phosphate aldolase
MTRIEEQEAREEIVRLAQALDAAGMMPSKSGNLSCRLDDGLLITPAGLPYAETRPADLVLLGSDGQVRSGGGGGRPSSEWRLHLAICRARPEVRAVVHTHSPKATALACARRGIPPFHYTIALAGGDIRCGDYATYGTTELADAAVRALAGRHAALLANHGVVAVGTSLGAAYTLAMEVENLARAYLALLAARLEPALLSEAELAEVAARFGDHGRSG